MKDMRENMKVRARRSLIDKYFGSLIFGTFILVADCPNDLIS
jgi:hypothetical protein